MYNQNMQQTKKKNIFQTALIFVIVGALLVIAGGTASVVHKHISSSATIAMLEESKKSRQDYINRTKEEIQKESNSASRTTVDGRPYLEYLKENLTATENFLLNNIEPNLSNAKIGQIYNVVGYILSVLGASVLIIFLIMRQKMLFEIGFFISGGFLAVTTWLFLRAFEGMFLNFYEFEHEYIGSIHQYGVKTPIFIHPWLRFLYITLIFAGWVMMFIAFKNAKKNADTIIVEAHQARQMKAQLQMQQQQYTQAPQQIQQQQYTQAPQQMQQQQYTQAPQQPQPQPQQPENTQQQQ